MKYLKLFESFDELAQILNIAKDEGFAIHKLDSDDYKCMIIQRLDDNKGICGESDDQFIETCQNIYDRIQSLGFDKIRCSSLFFSDKRYYNHYRRFLRNELTTIKDICTPNKGSQGQRDISEDTLGEISIEIE